MNTLKRISTEQWETLLDLRLLPPVLRYDPTRDRPAVPSCAVSWLDLTERIEDHHGLSLPVATGWPDRWTVGFRHGADERQATVREAAAHDLLTSDPVRSTTWHKHSRARAGLHHLASLDKLQWHESLFERDLLVTLDFDGGLTALASQPFTVAWHDGQKWIKHTPDFMAVLDGQTWVINVRPAVLVNDRLIANAAAVHAMCRLRGWQDAVVVGYPQPTLTVLQTLAAARYTDDPYDLAGVLLSALEAQGPSRFGDLVDATPAPALGRAVLQRLLWDRTVSTDLARLLTDETVIDLVEVTA